MYLNPFKMIKIYQKSRKMTLLLALAVFSQLYLSAASENTPAEKPMAEAFTFPVEITQDLAIACAGESGAAITATPGAGQAPFTFLWNTGAVTASITGLSAGTYSVIVTDALGVQVETIYEVTEPSPIDIDFDITPASNCTGPGTGAVEALASGGTGSLTYEWSNAETTANIANLEAGTYTLIARDENNCENQATAEVEVLDTTPPLVAVKTITVALDENGLAQIPVEAVDDGSTDNCGITDATLTKNNFDCSDLGENALTYTVFDAAGNSTAEEAIIFIVDESAPVAVASDMTLSLDENGFAVLDAELVGVNSTDNCEIVTKTLSKQNFSCLDIGDVSVVLTVTDGRGNSDETSFTVTVVDDMAPTITWVADAVLYLNDNGFAFATYNSLIESTDDNCGIDAGGFEESTFSCANVGFNDITYSQIDFYGNTSTHMRNVLVLDTVKPKFTLQEIEIELDSEGNAELTEEMLLPYATDNCGVAEVAIQVESYNCSQIGEAETQIIVFDMNGNFLQKTLYVLINDPFAPSATAQDVTLELDENGEAELTIEMVSYVYEDNCDQIELSLSQSSFNCADGPSASVFLAVTDGAGNTSEAPFNVTILDKIDPEIICSGPIERCEGIFQPGTLVMAFDNCDYAISQDSGPIAGSFLSPGEYEIVYTAADIGGNSAACAVPVHVSPQPNVELGEDYSVPSGTVVTLTADQFQEGFTYLWSTGEISPTIQVEVVEDVSISVVVSSGLACIAEDEILISTDLVSSVSTAKGTFGLNIYPNPSRNLVNVEVGISEIQENTSLTLVDLNGRVVYQTSLQSIAPGQVLSIDISQFAKGLYVLSIQTDTAYATAKIVKD